MCHTHKYIIIIFISTLINRMRHIILSDGETVPRVGANVQRIGEQVENVL